MKSVWKRFWKIFIKGLAAMIPLVVTVWVIIWLVVNAEAMLGGLIKSVLPEHLYVRGMGVVAGLVFVFCVGLLLNMVIARMLFQRFEMMLNRLPLVKSVYGSVRDLMGFFMDSEKKGQQVVMVTVWPEADQWFEVAKLTQQGFKQSDEQAAEHPEEGQQQAPRRVPMKLLGLVTRMEFSDLPKGIGDDQSVAVYLPMSYQLGGFTVIVKKSQVELIDMTTEDALRFAITAGMNTKTLVQG